METVSSVWGTVGLKYVAICHSSLNFRISLQIHQDRYKSRFDWLQNVHTLIRSVRQFRRLVCKGDMKYDDNLAFVLHVSIQWRSIRKRVYNKRTRGLRIFVMYGLISKSLLTVDNTRKRTDEVISPLILCMN